MCTANWKADWQDHPEEESEKKKTPDHNQVLRSVVCVCIVCLGNPRPGDRQQSVGTRSKTPGSQHKFSYISQAGLYIYSIKKIKLYGLK